VVIPTNTLVASHNTRAGYTVGGGLVGRLVGNWTAKMKKPPNQGKPWTSQNVRELDMLAKRNTPTRLIAFTMGRTLEAVYRKAKQKGISLKPTGRSPYPTKK
jgi:hypothetical protein